jgi:protein SCO1
MGEMVDGVREKCGNIVRPIFITCDPARDTPQVIKSYLEDFHPATIGLTGTYDEIKQTCKDYRVYFSTPPNLKPGQDYLVDHSIYFFLMGMLSFPHLPRFRTSTGSTNSQMMMQNLQYDGILD